MTKFSRWSWSVTAGLTSEAAFLTGISQLVRPASCLWCKQLPASSPQRWIYYDNHFLLLSLRNCSVSTVSKIRDPSFPNSSSLFLKVAGELRLAFKRRILHFQRGQTKLIHTNTNQLTSCKVTDQLLLSTIGVKTVRTGYKEISNTKKKSCLFFIGFFVKSFRERYSHFHHTLGGKKMTNLKAVGKPQFRMTERLNSTLCSLPGCTKEQFLRRLVAMMHPLSAVPSWAVMSHQPR